MTGTKGRISGANLGRVDGAFDHGVITSGMYSPSDNLKMAARKSNYYVNSISGRYTEYYDPTRSGNFYDAFFSSDGTKAVFLVDGYVQVCSLSEPYGQPSSPSSDYNLDTLYGSTGTWYTITFSNDGLYLFSSNSDDDYPQTFSLATAFDASSIHCIGKDVRMLPFISNDTGSTETGMTGHEFGNSGLKLYTVGTSLDRIAQYTLTTAYDVSTASYDGYKLINSINPLPSSVTWKPDGTKFFMTDYSNDEVHEISVSTNWDVTSTITLENSFDVSGQETSPRDVRFKPDGTMMFVVGITGDSVDAYTLSTAWDVSTASFQKTRSLSAQNSSPRGLDFSPDGTRMVVAGQTDDQILSYTLSTAWDIATETYNGDYHTSPYGVPSAFVQNGNEFNSKGISVFSPVSVRFINNGNGISVLDNHVSSSSYYAKVVNYTLGQAYNPLSITDGLLLDYRTQETSDSDIVYDIKFNADGTKVYVVNNYEHKIYQWTLVTPFTVSSNNYGMTYDGASVSFGASNMGGETALRAIAFNPEMDRLFVLGATMDKIFEYELGTPGDVTENLSVYKAVYSVKQRVDSENVNADEMLSPAFLEWTSSGFIAGGIYADKAYKINFVN